MRNLGYVFSFTVLASFIFVLTGPISARWQGGLSTSSAIAEDFAQGAAVGPTGPMDPPDLQGQPER